jgi:hypothetical protein
MSRSFFFATFIAVAVVSLGVAHGQLLPCFPDMQKFCRGVEPGQGRIRDCLIEHSAELSSECKTQMEAGRGIFSQRTPGAGGGQPLRPACSEDLREHCAGERGRAERLKCLRAHESELSDACREVLRQLPDATAKPAATANPAATAKPAATPAEEKPKSDG